VGQLGTHGHYKKPKKSVPFGVHKPTCEPMKNSVWSTPGLGDAIDEDLFCKMEEGLSRTDMCLIEAFQGVPGGTLREKLRHCAACKCCARHQKDKPRQFIHWLEPPEKSTLVSDSDRVTMCQCDCRHMARFICRQVPAIPQVEDAM
jgi:hypothetical protein